MNNDNQQQNSGQQQPLEESVVPTETISEESGDSNKKANQRKHEKVLSVLLVVAVCMLVLSFVLRFFVISGISITGDSMLPNFSDGGTVWVNKCAKPNRGDVVVVYREEVDNKFLAEFDFFHKTESDKYYKLIKRVVALEGDKLWVEHTNGDYVLVIETASGEILRENYYTVDGQPAQFYDHSQNLVDIPYLGMLGNLENTTQQAPFVVPEGCFYVMGDNRHISNDSRRIGPVTYSRLYGVVIEK